MNLFYRSVKWLIYRVGAQTILVLLLLGIVMVSVSWTLADLVRGLNFSDLLPLAVVALLLGWFMARLPWLDRRTGTILLFIVGVELAILHATDLEIQLIALLRQSGLLLWQLWWWPATLTPPQLEPLLETLIALYAGLSILQQLLVGWLSADYSGQVAPGFIAVAGLCRCDALVEHFIDVWHCAHLLSLFSASAQTLTCSSSSTTFTRSFMPSRSI